jgi:rod shape determining protein RodA
MAKITLIMVLAFYYDWLPDQHVSKPQWIIAPLAIIFLPFFLVLLQPDLGTSLLIVIGGGVMMFLAGVHWGYFGLALSLSVGGISTILYSRGKDWQLLNDYQY